MFLFRYLEVSPTMICKLRAIRSLQTANPRHLDSLPFSVWKNTASQELPDPDDRLDDPPSPVKPFPRSHLCTLRWMAWPGLPLSPRLDDTLKRVINICRPHASHLRGCLLSSVTALLSDSGLHVGHALRTYRRCHRSLLSCSLGHFFPWVLSQRQVAQGSCQLRLKTKFCLEGATYSAATCVWEQSCSISVLVFLILLHNVPFVTK